MDLILRMLKSIITLQTLAKRRVYFPIKKMPVIKTGIFINKLLRLLSKFTLAYLQNCQYWHSYLREKYIYCKASDIASSFICITLCFLCKKFWRKVRDSNSRCYISSTRPQQGRAFSHSANLPKRWFFKKLPYWKPATISLHHNVSKPGMIRIANVCNQRNQLPVGVILLDAYTVSCTYI